MNEWDYQTDYRFGDKVIYDNKEYIRNSVPKQSIKKAPDESICWEPLIRHEVRYPDSYTFC